MRPPRKDYSLLEQLQLLHEAGLTESPPTEAHDPLLPLPERIKAILGIVNDQVVKATDMTYLIMYDISSNKVRGHIAKYLARQGCIRIQKSVFIARSESKNFREIVETLREVNNYYQNADSILLAPINTSDLRALQVIGKDLQIDILQNPPNTLFF